MDRRQFFKGAIATGVAAALPKPEGIETISSTWTSWEHRLDGGQISIVLDAARLGDIVYIGGGHGDTERTKIYPYWLE